MNKYLMANIGCLFLFFTTLLSCAHDKGNQELKTVVTPHDSIGVNTCRLGGFNIQIKVDASWVKGGDQATYLSFRKNCEQKFCENIVIRIQKSASLSLDQVTESFVNQLKAEFTEFKVVQLADKMSGKMPIKIVDYKAHANGLHLGGTIALQIVEDSLISVSYMAENEPAGKYGEKRKEFTQILQGVNFSVAGSPR